MYKRGKGTQRLRTPTILHLLFFHTSAEGCTICIHTKGMTPFFLNVIIKSMFFVLVNIKPVVSVYFDNRDVFVITCFLFAPAELKINAPELVDRRTY